MAKGKQNAAQAASVYFEKAVRRGEKLEKTLLKLIAGGQAGSSAEELLKALQAGLKKLKKTAKGAQAPVTALQEEPVKTRAASKNIKAEPTPKPVKRRSKKPADTEAAKADPA